MKSLFLILFLMFQPPKVEIIEKSKYQTFIKKGYKIIDVRTPQEFHQGHIQGAQNIDVRAENFVDEIQNLSESDTLLVYCRSGRRSLYAAQVMISFGFKKIYDLEGGFLNW
tara:strand:+ start:65 stop:397 length:333 start_codon:yes stop_codon:yes gene_type:complete